MVPQASHSTQRGFTLGGWLPEIALLLVFFATRLYRLDDTPIFIDEVFHIHRARDVWQLKALHFIWTTKVLNVWLTALLVPFDHARWVGRSLDVLVGAISLSSVYKMGQALFNRRAGLVGGLLYTLAPLTFFHERLALADPVAAAAGATLLVASLMFTRRPTWRLAMLTGIMLAAALLAKAPMLTYLLVPALTVLWMQPRHLAGRVRVVQLGGIYLLVALLIAPIVALGVARTDLGSAEVGRHTALDIGALADQAIHNVRSLAQRMWVWLTPPLFGLLVAGAVLALASRRRGAWWLLAVAALPIVSILVVADVLYTRYYLPGFPALFALAGLGISLAWEAARRFAPPDIVRWVGVGLLAGVAVLPTSFFVTAYRDVAALSLPRSDYIQYVASYSSGYGWQDAAAWLAGQAKRSQRTLDVITLAEGYEWRFQITLYGVPNIRLFHDRTLPPDWLSEHVGDSDTEVYLLLDTPKNAVDWARYDVRPVLIGTYPRPGDLSAVEVYRLDPPQ